MLFRPALVHVEREMESLKEMNGVYHGVMVAILAMSVFNVFCEASGFPEYIAFSHPLLDPRP